VKLGAVKPPAICYTREPRLHQAESSALSRSATRSTKGAEDKLFWPRQSEHWRQRTLSSGRNRNRQVFGEIVDSTDFGGGSFLFFWQRLNSHSGLLGRSRSS